MLVITVWGEVCERVSQNVQRIWEIHVPLNAHHRVTTAEEVSKGQVDKRPSHKPPSPDTQSSFSGFMNKVWVHGGRCVVMYELRSTDFYSLRLIWLLQR